MPNRVIRDSVLDSDRYVGLTHDAERLLFLELLLMADDFGLVPLNFAFLRRRASPCAGRSEKQVNEMVEQLVERDLVRLYRSGSASLFGYIPRFGNVPRAKKPKWPLPPDQPAFSEINNLARSCAANVRTCNANAQHLQTNEPETETETETYPTKGGECFKGSGAQATGDTPRKRSANTTGSRLPSDWVLSRELGEWAMQDCGMTREAVKAEAEKFADYWHGVAGAKGRKADWAATWRNWCRNAKVAAPSRNGHPAMTRGERDAEAARLLGFDIAGKNLDTIEAN